MGVAGQKEEKLLSFGKDPHQALETNFQQSKFQ